MINTDAPFIAMRVNTRDTNVIRIMPNTRARRTWLSLFTFPAFVTLFAVTLGPGFVAIPLKAAGVIPDHTGEVVAFTGMGTFMLVFLTLTLMERFRTLGGVELNDKLERVIDIKPVDALTSVMFPSNHPRYLDARSAEILLEAQRDGRESLTEDELAHVRWWLSKPESNDPNATKEHEDMLKKRAEATKINQMLDRVDEN